VQLPGCRRAMMRTTTVSWSSFTTVALLACVVSGWRRQCGLTACTHTLPCPLRPPSSFFSPSPLLSTPPLSWVPQTNHLICSWGCARRHWRWWLLSETAVGDVATHVVCSSWRWLNQLCLVRHSLGYRGGDWMQWQWHVVLGSQPKNLST
jgi:hypothetical protein